MEDTVWHAIDLSAEQFLPAGGQSLQIPPLCTWCGNPGQHTQRVRVEGAGVPEKMRWVILETSLCSECHQEQRKIELGGWGLMVGGMALYVAQSALLPALGLQEIAGTVNMLSILALLGLFLWASRRWQAARHRRGIRLRPADPKTLRVSVRSVGWLNEFRQLNSWMGEEDRSSISGE